MIQLQISGNQFLNNDESEEQILNGSCTDEELKHSAAIFLLRTHEEHKVTQVALNGIVQGVRGLWDDAIQHLKVYLHSCILCQ